MRLVVLSSVLFGLFVAGSVQAEEKLHPHDVLLLGLSQKLQTGSIKGRVDVSDTVLSCAGFFKAMNIEVSNSKYATVEGTAGLNKMSGDMRNLSFVLMTGLDEDVSKLIADDLEQSVNDEIIVLRANGLESVAFLRRYRECKVVYYFANYVLLNGKGAAKEALDKLQE